MSAASSLGFVPEGSRTPSVERVADFLTLCAEIRAKVEARREEARGAAAKAGEPQEAVTALTTSPVKAGRKTTTRQKTKARVSQHASLQVHELESVVQ